VSADLLYGLAALLAAGGVALVAAGLLQLLRWRYLARRLRAYATVESTLSPTPESQPGRLEKRAANPLSRGVQRRLIRSSYGAMVQARLTRAGMTRKASEIIIVQVGLGLLLGLGGLVLVPAAPLGRLLIGIVLGVAGAVGPLLWLNGRGAARLTAFEKQLPQAIDAMASSLQAGSSLQQAMAILAREMPAPIAVEFRRVLREAELGLSFPDSLAELANRVPSTDLVIFTSAVSIQQRVGGDLASIFRVISHTVRERLRIRAETKVLTSQGRYSAYIIGGLPVLLFGFLWLINYPYLSGLLQPGIPRVLLGGGIAGIVLGFFMMQKIATVEV
jgi:tight adherence protein B